MLVIGIAGGSGSGKTTVVKAIMERLKAEKVVVIPQDSYYKDSSDLTDEEKRNHNFDHPDAIDWELLSKQLSDLKNGYSIEQPVYSYISCSRSKTETVKVEPADVIIYSPDMVDGHFVTSGSRNKFYSQNNIINAQLPDMIKDATQILIRTVDQISALYKRKTVGKEDPKLTEEYLNAIHDYYKSLV